jgi:hypothetical protein
MKKILIVLALFLTSSFAQQVAFQITEKSQKLYTSIMSGRLCDVPTIEKLIKEGADVNYLKYGKPEDGMYTRVAERKNPSCDKAAELLKSAGAKSREQFQAEWEAKQPKKSEEELSNEEFMAGVAECDIAKVKSAIQRGANKDSVDKKTGRSAFASTIAKGSKCAAIGYYLSSIGADSVGFNVFFVLPHIYDKPKVFENKHLKMLMGTVGFDGYSDTNITNKTDDPVYIYSGISETNGYKKSWGSKNYPSAIQPERIIKLDIFSPFYAEEKEKYPKIINNHVKFNRQITIKYKYKDKEYELKTPVMNEEFDVVYDHEGIATAFGIKVD